MLEHSKIYKNNDELDIKEIVRLFLENTLVTGENSCGHGEGHVCHGHGEDHHCGHHH